MEKSNIIIDPFVLSKISCSDKLKNVEKIRFLKYVWYLTKSERKELIQII